jgi:hypothetical protein
VALRVAAVALVRLGRLDAARSAIAELLAIEPGLTISGFFARIPFPVERLARIYAEGLAEAGLPA